MTTLPRRLRLSAPPPSKRRSFIILAVLVITGSALFIATGALFMAQAELAGASGIGAAAQSRSLAWSGVQVLMGELNQQRERILQGELPTLDEEYRIYESDFQSGVIRLLPIAHDGARLVPEAGKLNVHTIDAERLAATGVVDEELAEQIIAFRDSLGRPMQSIAELLAAPGVSPELLYGPLDELGSRPERSALADSRSVADVLTVFAVEPPLQRDGRLRINLNVEWSDELARRLDERFGQGASQIVKQIIDGGAVFDSDRVIVEVLRFFDVPHEDWPDILDVLTTDDAPYAFGRLDINSASEQALRGLPGVTPEQATQIVRIREGLDRDSRTTIVWPLLHNILSEEAYEELIDKMTARSWTYRVRIAAGEVDAEQPDGELLRPVVWEAVIDLADPQPRLAYLRDVTMLQTTAMIAANLGVIESDDPWPPEADEEEEITNEGANEGAEFASGSDDVPAEPAPDDQDAGATERNEPNERNEGSSQRIGRWIPG